MDQDVGWWAEVVFAGWRDRPGPRYQRLATALVDAVQERVLGDGTPVPAERRLAGALGVSRGTVVACFDQLVAAGVLRRRQGAGTFIVARPSWTGQQPGSGVAALLLRRLAMAGDGIDLSLSVPGSLGHLPPIDTRDLLAGLDGHGLEPAGLPVLREQLARFLTEHQQLPTTPDQLLVTAGAQEALLLLGRVLGDPPPTVLLSCPGYPGLGGALAEAARAPRVVAADGGGIVPHEVDRAVQRHGSALVYVVPTGHNPTGTVMPASRREALAALAASGRCIVVEDLSQADLYFGDVPPPPIAASSERVVAVGSLSKLLWAGLRIGWVRAEPDLLRALLAQKAAATLATAAPAQLVATSLLAAIDAHWLAEHRRALARRRDHLVDSVRRHLPGWRCQPPAAGLSLWLELPVVDADAFTHAAGRHGVTVAPGSTACACGRHRHGIRVSFAEQLHTLDLAVERLTSAWEAYSEDLAAAPAHRSLAS